MKFKQTEIKLTIYNTLEKGSMTGNKNPFNSPIIKTAIIPNGCENFLLMPDDIVDLMITYIEANAKEYSLGNKKGVKSIFIAMWNGDSNYEDFTWNDDDRPRSVAIAEACCFVFKELERSICFECGGAIINNLCANCESEKDKE